MANLHILNFGIGGYRVAIHVAVPAGNNAAGVPWQSAVLNGKCCGAGSSVMTSGDGTLGTIAASELASIQNGAIYEEVAEIDAGNVSGMTSLQRTAYLDAFVTAKTVEVQDRLRHHLNFFGATR